MNREQLKHLHERLSKARQSLSPYRIVDQEKPPAAVVRARKVVKAWEARRIKKREAIMKKITAAAREVEEAIFFGDPVKALAALKKFEAMKVTP